MSNVFSRGSSLSLTQVSQDYDAKENMFRTPPFLAVPHKPLTLAMRIAAQGKPKITYYVMFIDPLKNKYSFKLPPITASVSSDNQWFDGSLGGTHVWFSGFEIPVPLQVGPWGVFLYRDEFRVPTMKTFFHVHATNRLMGGEADRGEEALGQWRLKTFCIGHHDDRCSIGRDHMCTNCSTSRLLRIDLIG